MDYSRTYEVKWSELDPNGHLRHTAYGDYTVDVRVHFLGTHGFSISRLHQTGIGPVILKEESSYLREVVMGESITVNIKLAGISSDGSHWLFQHEVFKPNGKKAAIVLAEGGWLDLQARKLVAPPGNFHTLTDSLEHTDNFAELSSYLR